MGKNVASSKPVVINGKNMPCIQEYYEMRRYKLPLHNNSDVTNIILNKVVTPTSPQKTTKS